MSISVQETAAGTCRLADRPEQRTWTGEIQNVGRLERVISTLAGSAGITAGVALAIQRRSPWHLLWAVGGSMLAVRGVRGHCGIYNALGIRGDDAEFASHPLSRGIHVDHSVTIHRPVTELYSFWRDLENLPRVLRHVESVRVLDPRRSRWLARGPGDRRIEWEAEITEDRPNERIAWCSLGDSDLATRGSVEFHSAAGGRGTVVRFNLFMKPPAGAVGAILGKLFGRDPHHELQEDLRRFKQVCEAGEIISAAGPSARAAEPPGSAPGGGGAPGHRERHPPSGLTDQPAPAPAVTATGQDPCAIPAHQAGRREFGCESSSRPAAQSPEGEG